jgi:hypothetical protein
MQGPPNPAAQGGGFAMKLTSIRIGSVFYDAARRTWISVVDFFAPGLPMPLRIPVRFEGPRDISHTHLVRTLVDQARRRGIH